MIDMKLTEIRKLKQTATSLRNRDEFDLAQDNLDKAIQKLKDLQATTSDEADLRELRGEIADTYGMKGGVYRRQGKLDEALGEYTIGREWEKIDNFSTYNLSNIISLKIDWKNFSPEGLRDDIQAAIEQLTKETQGTRKDEWWAWADLAQFYLLLNNPDEARRCYAEGRSTTGATRGEIERHVSILSELANKTKETAPSISKNIKSVINEL
jgi:tetratricopeptide (TPR) repeat protein